MDGGRLSLREIGKITSAFAPTACNVLDGGSTRLIQVTHVNTRGLTAMLNTFGVIIHCSVAGADMVPINKVASAVMARPDACSCPEADVREGS